jgi:hypothetical protein
VAHAGRASRSSGLDHDQGGQDEHQAGQPDQGWQDDGGGQGGQQHAGGQQPWQAQRVVHAALEQRRGSTQGCEGGEGRGRTLQDRGDPTAVRPARELGVYVNR